jgi:hypothetical protein
MLAHVRIIRPAMVRQPSAAILLSSSTRTRDTLPACACAHLL